MSTPLHSVRAGLDLPALGERLHALMARLYPICRSITGPGVRETLQILGERIPGLEVRGVDSGTRAFDWIVPPEWRIRQAWIKGPDGRRVVDLAAHNLHVLNYSIPVRQTLSLDELKKHLHTLPEQPTWIPYRTSYYKRDWGFCMRHADFVRLQPGNYEVCVDADLDEQGRLEWGEAFFRGQEEGEVLLSTHVCHPSLCNDNLSGVVIAPNSPPRSPRARAAGRTACCSSRAASARWCG